MRIIDKLNMTADLPFLRDIRTPAYALQRRDPVRATRRLLLPRSGYGRNGAQKSDYGVGPEKLLTERIIRETVFMGTDRSQKKERP